ncbi:hypothetical protein DFH09DRAFT_1099731 [Mycena vulgaris]|nr:hypothetical protein DFH09DRAFT_1099731 [Mycena vulgaris]
MPRALGFNNVQAHTAVFNFVGLGDAINHVGDDGREVLTTAMHVSTYHSFVVSKGNKFEKPDLCIAFNSGASQALTDQWLPTLKLLVEHKIPTVFTSLDREEAEGEAALLRTAGATLHSALGPSKNPWGSMKMVPASNKVYGFSSDSGWLAGGFS